MSWLGFPKERKISFEKGRGREVEDRHNSHMRESFT
jgi:hypothetical protein